MQNWTCTRKAALRFRSQLCFRLLIVLPVLVIPRSIVAQVTDPINAARAPVPGAGHDYIGTATETVNPADGTPSFYLPIQTPPGRQLSLSFGIRYNGAAPFYIAGNGESPHFYWTSSALNGTPPPFDLNGWSYALPNYVAQAFVSGESQTGGPPGEGQTNYCWAGQNYQFSGLDGVQQNLFVTNNWADVDNPQQDVCPVTTYAGGGEDGLATTFGNATTNIQPTLAVTDKSGTVYQFPQGPAIATNPTVVGGGITPFGLLPQTITDRNGNQLTLSGSNSGNSLGAGSYSDTLGRTVVSWSGLGNSAGDQLAVSGLPSNIVVKWTTTTVTLPANSQFLTGSGNGSTCGFSDQSGLTISVVSEIDLPNGQLYSFEYGAPWGLLTKITFPNGGYTRYAWGTNPASQITYQQWTPQANDNEHCYALVDMPAITDRWVSYDGVSESLHQVFQYGPTSIVNDGTDPPSWSSKMTTVTSNDAIVPAQSNTTTYTYTPVGVTLGPNDTSWQTLQVPVEQSVVYQDSNGSTTVNKTWMDRFTMIGQQTVLSNGQSMTTLRCPDLYDRIVAVYEYDFQANGPEPSSPTCTEAPYGSTALAAGLPTAFGPLLRQTITTYHSFASTHILDEPDSVVVQDGASHQVALTNYAYDAGAVNGSGTTVGLVAPPGLRGNATSVARWASATNSYVTNTYTYYDTGQIYTATDACGNTPCADMISSGMNPHTTTYSYADQFAAGTGTPPDNAQTNAYLTQVTYPNTGVAHQESFTWGYNDGLVMSHTDQNQNTTNYTYNDPLLRLKEVQGPVDPNNGGQRPTTTYSYADWTPMNQTSSTITSSEVQNVAGASVQTNTVLNGMGQVTSKQVTSDPYGTDFVDTTYDGFGRVHTVSNPHRSSQSPTDGTTTFNYDVLNRKIGQTDSDGTSQQSWLYSGNGVKYTDEDGNQWQRYTDALERLSQVFEPGTTSKSPSVETDYSYDLLNNLVGATQKGASGDTPVTRSFVFDSLSRLESATNAESGTTLYGYDANGNVSSRADARGSAGTVNYCFDTLNRVISKGYSGQTCPMTSPDVSYAYDSSSIVGNANVVGRLTGEAASIAGVVWAQRQPYAYNPMGQIMAEQQCVPGNCAAVQNSLQYTYDLAGNMTSSTNGVANPGVLFTYSYDCANRLGMITSSWDAPPNYPATLFAATPGGSGNCPTSSNSNYTPTNQLQNAQIALVATNMPAMTVARTYDSRLRPTSETDTAEQSTPGVPASAVVTISGAEQSIAGSGNPTAATGTISLSYSGGQMMGARPLYVGNSITLPDGYHASFVATANSAVVVANALAAVLNAAASPVTAVVSSGGTASAASLVLTAKVTGADENGPITLSLTTTQVKASPASMSGGAGTTYDSGTVTANINGTPVTTSYGQGSTPQTVAQALAAAISSAGAGVTATADSSGAVTVAADQGGPADNGWPVTLSSATDQPKFFSSPSFGGTSGTLTGGQTGSQAGPIYQYSIAAPAGGTGYDPVGNITDFSDCVNNNCAASDCLNGFCGLGTWHMQPSNLNQISSASSTVGPWNGLSMSWLYDAFGNRQTQTLTGTPPNPAPGSQTFSYTSQNQITNFGPNGYDPAGNVKYDLTNSYLYDAEGRVCAVAYPSGAGTAYMVYIYDAEGRRVGKGSNPTFSCTPASDGFVMQESYILGQSGELVSELNASGGFLRGHVYADGQLLATYDNSATRFAFNDWLGTKRLEANPQGGVIASCINLPFGDELICYNGSLNGHHFTGKIHDKESGNDYFGARYYASSMGRFMSPDPLGGHLEDPQTLNKYSYVANNPLSRTDPTGLDFNLQCTQTKDNASTCQGGLQGTTTTDANGKSTFTATRISSDAKGNLSDQNGNKYSGAFDGKNVSFTGADGSKSTGSWIQNSNPTSGITGSGSLSNNFNFTFYNHGANQTLNFTFTYSGSMTQAFGELRNAGFTHWNTGDDIGFSEWRTDVAGRNSSHFLVWDPNWLEQQTMSPPSTLPQGPGTKGEGHVGEYYPGVRHTVCDVLGIC